MRIHPRLSAPCFSASLLRREARRHGLGVSRLAERTGLHWQSVWNYWTGLSKPPHGPMLALAKACETETSAFFDLRCPSV